MRRIQVVAIKESKRVKTDKLVKLLKDAIKKIMRTGDAPTIPSFNMSQKQCSEVVQKIKRLKGVKSASVQTLSHYYGLGGMFGWGIEVRLKDAEMPLVQWNDDGSFLINTHKFLSQFEVDKKLTKLVQSQDLSDAIEHLEKTFGLEFKGDNTYNYVSDFTQDFNFWSTGIESAENGKCIVLLAIHEGGDVRGNYGEYVAYSMDYDEYCSFLNFHYGFYNEVEQDDRYTSGYTSEPQYNFFKDYELVSLDRDAETITVKNKESGKVETFIPEVPHV